VAPVPRVRAGRLAARSRSVSAAVDLSDGLADAISQLATASRVGAVVEAAAVPVDADARRQAATLGLDPIALALAGGDDYDLLFAVRPRRRRAFLAAMAHARPTTVTRIGVTTAALDLVLASEHGSTPLPAGFAHFGVASTLE
jgi:thiamine-monophosphate kinase